MTVKFVNTANAALKTKFQVVDSASLDFPNADWAIGFAFVLDGVTTGGGLTYLFSTGSSSSGGNINIMFAPSGGDANYSNKIMAYVTGVGGFLARSPSLTAGQAYVAVLQRISNVVNLKICPVLTTEPTNGSAVITGTNPASLTSAVTPTTGIVIGQNYDNGSQGSDQSMGRVFMLPSSLTDFEVAKLAFGYEITELGKTPSWYLRLNTDTDTTDRGALGLTFTKTGTPVTGSALGFGHAPPVAPSFSTVPVIVGTPQVTQSSAYTRGTFDGSPTPTITQQWLIDDVEVSGATGATYIPVSADQGKTLKVRQILTNTSAPSGVSATSAGVAVIATQDTISVILPDAERIYQRIGSTATVPLTGSYTGTLPASIEYQLYAIDGTTVRQAWTSIGATIAMGGSWSAAPSIPSHLKKYRIQIRSKTSGGAPISTSEIYANRFGVGDLIAFVGSSSASSWAGTISGNSFTPDLESTSIMWDSGWANMGTTGSAVNMAKAFAAAWGCCVAILPYGASGTRFDNDWLNTSAQAWQTFSTNVAKAGNKLAGVFSSMGSNDASGGYITSRAAHAANLRTFISRVRAQCDQPALQFLLSGFNRRTDKVNITQAQFDVVSDYLRQAESDVGSDANVFHVQTLDFELSSDGVHLTSAGFIACCNRMTQVFSTAHVGGAYPRGPEITGFTFSGSTVKVPLALRNGTDFIPASGITGFTVNDAGVDVPIVSALRTSANLITITSDRALTAPIVKYLSGSAPPVGTPVFDNSALALPMTVETSMATTQETAGATAAPLGVTATTSVGTAITTGGAAASPLGVSASASVGQSAATGGGAGVAAPAGVGAVASVGTASASGGAIATPAGVSASASVGTVTASAGSSAVASPAGVAAQSSVGQVVATGSATAQPAGVGAQASIGQVIASGTILIGATAMPLGVSAAARVGVAVANGGVTYARAPEGPGYSPRSRCFSSRPPASQGNCT